MPDWPNRLSRLCTNKTVSAVCMAFSVACFARTIFDVWAIDGAQCAADFNDDCRWNAVYQNAFPMLGLIFLSIPVGISLLNASARQLDNSRAEKTLKP